MVVESGNFLRLTCPFKREPHWTGPFSVNQIVQNNHILEIKSVTEQNAGLYTCQSLSPAEISVIKVFVGSKYKFNGLYQLSSLHFVVNSFE